MAISAPARSIVAQATSTSRLRITSRIETWCTSTSYIDTSSESGSMPWLMVKLPCGSRSTQSTRWSRSTNAAARLRVVVVLATPPFWFVKAMTLAVGSIRSAYSHALVGFLPASVLRGARRPELLGRPRPRDHRVGVVAAGLGRLEGEELERDGERDLRKELVLLGGPAELGHGDALGPRRPPELAQQAVLVAADQQQCVAPVQRDGRAVQEVLGVVALGKDARGLAQLERALAGGHRGRPGAGDRDEAIRPGQVL